MNDVIIITVSFSKYYVEQATVMLYSLFLSNKNNRFKIVVFYNDLDEAAQRRVTSNLNTFTNFEIEWVKIDGSLIKNFNIRKGHVNEYTYTRIFVAHLLQGVSRYLHFDCDMLVLGDVMELWQTDLKGNTIAAVEDSAPFTRQEDIGFPHGKKYFNAGVIVCDVAKWKEKNYTEAVINSLNELGGMAAWLDQDGLNVTVCNDWLPLHKKWNTQSHDIMVAQNAGIKNIKEYLAPSIIHFTGNLKPWNFKSSNPYKDDYYRILRHTDFLKMHRPENKTPLNIARRAARNVFVFMGIMKY